MNGFCRFRSTCFPQIFLILTGGLWLGTLSLRAADYYVRPSATCTNTDLQSPYTNWDMAATNIQWAVDVAMSNVPATVWVSNGTYCLTSQIRVTNNITVKGVHGWTNTLVCADWPAYTTRCFYISRTGVVDGFTISNGHIFDSYGGGAYIAASGTVQNCYFVNNTCSNSSGYVGAGVVINNQGIVSNCIFYSNSFSAGQNGLIGAVVSLRYGGTVLDCMVISNCYITSKIPLGAIGGNSKGYDILISNCFVARNDGYGIFLDEDDMDYRAQVIDCVSSNNTSIGLYVHSGIWKNCVTKNNGGNGIENYSSYHGGIFSNCTSINNGQWGIYISGSTNMPIYDGCVVQSNGTGGIRFSSGGIVRNCLISHNSSSSGGVDLVNSANYNEGTEGPGGLFNCTIVNNSASGRDGGGIYARGTNKVVNCIVVSNATTFAGAGHVDIYNADLNNSNYYFNCCCTATNTDIFAPDQGNITNDPHFVSPGAGNWRLSANSPCVNTGTNFSWMTDAVDMDGRQRIRYGTVDMGAYEIIYNGTLFTFP